MAQDPTHWWAIDQGICVSIHVSVYVGISWHWWAIRHFICVYFISAYLVTTWLIITDLTHWWAVCHCVCASIHVSVYVGITWLTERIHGPHAKRNFREYARAYIDM